MIAVAVCAVLLHALARAKPLEDRPVVPRSPEIPEWVRRRFEIRSPSAPRPPLHP